MSLSYKDAAFMLAKLEQLASGDKKRVEEFILWAMKDGIGGAASQETWKRMKDLLDESMVETKRMSK